MNLRQLPVTIFLIGFMGAGKSSVGRMLADRLNYTFLDTDELVREKAGKRIPAIFTEDGESRFRELEREVLLDVINRSRTVISTGGGIPILKSNMDIIRRAGCSVALLAPEDILYERIKNSRGRPLLKDRKYFISLFREREEFYKQADIEIDTSQLRVEEVVEELLELIKNPGEDLPGRV